MLPASVMAAFMIFADANIYLSYIYREIMRNRFRAFQHEPEALIYCNVLIDKK